MKHWRGFVLAGALSLSTLVCSAQEQTKKSDKQIPDTVIVRMIPNIQEWDYSNLDSAMMENIKSKVYPYKNSKPTKFGINAYVEEQWESTIYDFQKFFGVRIYSMDFEVDNLSLYFNREDDDNNDEVTVTNMPVSAVEDEMGVYWVGHDYATISNEEKYLGYSLKTTKKSKLWNIISSNQFVRGVMLHEMAHDYIVQTISELRYEEYAVDRAFSANYSSTSQSVFIEEGIAEYCPTVMGEVIQGKKVIPKSIDEMLDKNTKQNFFYNYSVHFVQDFINSHGLRDSVRILLSNPPPTNEEILKPELYFSRLKPPQKRLESQE